MLFLLAPEVNIFFKNLFASGEIRSGSRNLKGDDHLGIGDRPVVSLPVDTG